MTAAFRIPPQHLLVATDLSPRSGLALRRAAAIATEHDAAITAVHAVAPGVHPERADYARSRLHALANEHAPTVVVNTLVRVGKPKVVIADEVCNCGADLLLVRSPHRRRRTDAIRRGLVTKLAQLCGIPVLGVTNPATGNYRTVLSTVETSTALPAGTVDDLARGVDMASARIIVSPRRSPRAVSTLVRRHEADLVLIQATSRSPLGPLCTTVERVLRRAPADVLIIPT